jgi:hypothetical protein
MRFQIGHTPQIERTRVPVGKGVVGQVALTRQPILLNDVSTADFYIAANPDVRSELAVPSSPRTASSASWISKASRPISSAPSTCTCSP